MATLVVSIALVVCALKMVRAARLLHAALWLAGVSILVAILLYSLGAPQASVIELSVGAGLVLILFTFAISLTGDSGSDSTPAIPRALAGGLVAVLWLLLAVAAWPRGSNTSAQAAPLSTSLWVDRQLDIAAQIVLIFAGALTITGLLSKPANPVHDTNAKSAGDGSDCGAGGPVEGTRP